MNHVIAEVVDQHVEEAALLWCRRDLAIGEPHFTLADLARLDDQLAAHLDGICIAERDTPGTGWNVCRRELRWQSPGEVFAATVLACESYTSRRVAEALKAASHCYDCSRACVSSLGWISAELADPIVNQLLVSTGSFERCIAVAACAVRGRDPGEKLAEALESRDTFLQARALRAVGELARRDLLPLVKKSLEETDPHVRFSAAWAAARLEGNERANEILIEVVQSIATDSKPAESPTSDQMRALQLVLRRLNPSEAKQWLNQLSRSTTLLRSVIIGMGVLGLPDFVPWLLQLMPAPSLARIAGEAFTMITGLDLAAEKFDAPWPAGFTAGPTEDPADDNVVIDPDENLPWPEAAQLAAWWQEHSPHFQLGTRYLCGRPLTEDWLEHVLRYGYQRQRAAAALELALLRPDQPLFNVRAPGHRQQELLGLR